MVVFASNIFIILFHMQYKNNIGILKMSVIIVPKTLQNTPQDGLLNVDQKSVILKKEKKKLTEGTT